MERLLRTFLNPQRGAVVFAVALVVFYGIAVWWVNVPMLPETEVAMSWIPWVSGLCVILGSMCFRHRADVRYKERYAKWAVYGVFWLFVAFCVVTILTASSIPLLKALHGASAANIAAAREDFLKARTGWAASLPYFNGFLTASLLPYCMCIALLRKYRYRWVIVAVFFAYSLIFVEKAFFLRIFLPLMGVVVVNRDKRLRLTQLAGVAVLLLLGNIAVSGFATSTGTSVGDFLLFRAFHVPISTVTDSLNYWFTEYHGSPLMGATNLLLSTLFGMQRIFFERQVFVYEWGPSVTGTGSSNAAYFVEAYVNFGVLGVIFVSFLLGALISYIGRSRDLALRCILPLILYTVFVGGLLGVLFGNGLLICLVLSEFLNRRLRIRKANQIISAA